MSLELIMNADGTIGHGEGSTITGGEFTINSEPSEVMKIDDKGVFRGELEFEFAGGVAPGLTDVATIAPEKIQPTAAFVADNGDLVIRLGDSIVMKCGGITPDNKTAPIAGLVEVDGAGQSAARAE